MPFIDCKISQKLDERQKEKLKSELGGAVTLINKPESYLMVGISDGYSLYFAGKKVEDGAYVSVDLYGAASPSAYRKMTGKICEILSSLFGIAAERVYVEYRETANWGWNGSNF